MFSIHSVVSDRELIFSAHRDEYFDVQLKSKNISMSTGVWATTDANGLNKLFQELASFGNPWQGERSWNSLEGEFEISATCSKLGQVFFEVTLHGNYGGTEEWRGKASLEIELGQLTKIAQHANIFFTENFYDKDEQP